MFIDEGGGRNDVRVSQTLFPHLAFWPPFSSLSYSKLQNVFVKLANCDEEGGGAMGESAKPFWSLFPHLAFLATFFSFLGDLFLPGVRHNLLRHHQSTSLPVQRVLHHHQLFSCLREGVKKKMYFLVVFYTTFFCFLSFFKCKIRFRTYCIHRNIKIWT